MKWMWPDVFSWADRMWWIRGVLGFLLFLTTTLIVGHGWAMAFGYLATVILMIMLAEMAITMYYHIKGWSLGNANYESRQLRHGFDLFVGVAFTLTCFFVLTIHIDQHYDSVEPLWSGPGLEVDLDHGNTDADEIGQSFRRGLNMLHTAVMLLTGNGYSLWTPTAVAAASVALPINVVVLICRAFGMHLLVYWFYNRRAPKDPPVYAPLEASAGSAVPAAATGQPAWTAVMQQTAAGQV